MLLRLPHKTATEIQVEKIPANAHFDRTGSSSGQTSRRAAPDSTHCRNPGPRQWQQCRWAGTHSRLVARNSKRLSSSHCPGSASYCASRRAHTSSYLVLTNSVGRVVGNAPGSAADGGCAPL